MILHKQFPVSGRLVFCLGTICLLFCGCEGTPSSKGVFIKHKGKYIALEKFPLEIQIQNVKGGFVRTYHLKDETLKGAKTFYGRKHRFLINSINEYFRIIPVNQEVIVKYKYIRFKSYVHFSEVKINNIDKVSIAGDHRFMDANFEPGRYVLVPWKDSSPLEPVSYGFIIQTSPPPAKTQPPKEKPKS